MNLVKFNATNMRTNLLKVLQFSLLLLVVMSFTNCKKDTTSSPSTQPATGTPTPGASTGSGGADITLTAGSSEFKIVGPCGWASAGGAKYIGANHSLNSNRIFAVYFDIDTPPSITTTYTLTDSNLKEDPKFITMNVAEIAGNKLTEWSSTKTSGTLTLKVEGNKITANLGGITLAPRTEAIVFANGNTGDFAKDGKLTGTLTFYR